MGLLSALALLTSIKSCNVANSRATITSLESIPANPIPGDNVTLQVGYTFTGDAITGGTAAYTATLNYLPIYNEKFDLCTQTKCPKQPGNNTETSTSPFPTGVSGKLISTIDWTDQSGNPIWCVETTWKV